MKNLLFAVLALVSFNVLLSQSSNMLTADTTLARQFLLKSISLNRKELIDESIDTIEIARDLLHKHGLDETVLMADILHQMASVLGAKKPKRFQEALEIGNEVIRLRTLLLGQDDLELAKSLNNQATRFTNIDPHQALKLHQQSLAIRIKNQGAEGVDVAASYFNMAQIWVLLGDLPEAERSISKALDIRIKKLKPGEQKLLDTWNRLGTICFEKYDFEKAIEIFEKILAENENADFDDNVLLNLANCYQRTGKPDRAIANLEKILAGNHLILQEPQFLSKVHRVIGNSLLDKSDYIKAIEYFQKSLDITKEHFGDQSSEAGEALHALGACMFYAEKYEAALEHFASAEKIFKDYPSISTSITQVWNSIARTYLEMGQYETSIIYFRKALNYSGEKYGRIHPALASDFGGMALVLKAIGKYQEALSTIDSALFCNSTESGFSNILYLINKCDILKDMCKLDSSNLVLEQIDQVATLLLSKLKAINQLQISEVYEKEMLVTTRNAYKILIPTLLFLDQKRPQSGYLELAFEASELSKSQQLIAIFQKTKAQKIAGVPDSILAKEHRLNIDLAFWQKSRSNKLQEGLSETDSTVLKISGHIFDLKDQLAKFNRQLETDYPRYAALRYGSQPISIRQVQASLPTDDQAAVLEYFYEHDNLMAFVITKNLAQAFEIPVPFNMKDSIESLVHGITAYHQLPEFKQNPSLLVNTGNEYIRQARLLYKTLIAPLQPALRPELLIITDGVLERLPFEALLTADPVRSDRYHTFEYLIKRFRIHYSWSATFQSDLEQQSLNTDITETGVLAMAPFAHLDTTFLAGLDWSDSRGGESPDLSQLSRLPFSATESFAATQIFGGNAQYDTAATRQYFLEHASLFRLILLATHADANAQSSELAWVAFAPQKGDPENTLLYSSDIYNLKLNADLVILSACNTGQGDLTRSEGIMSLARAFTWAGARSVVSSLWKVSDASTERLMRTFFLGLKSDLNKSEALQAAKLELLKVPGTQEQERYKNLNVSWERFSHPYFWAGFTLRGNAVAIR